MTPATARPGYSVCVDCAGEVLRVVDDAGQAHLLDTLPQTWVVIGHGKDGTPRVRRSASYVEHDCARRPTATHAL